MGDAAVDPRLERVAQQADMISHGWNRWLASDRAAVVREVLAHTAIPVLLLPGPS